MTKRQFEKLMRDRAADRDTPIFLAPEAFGGPLRPSRRIRVCNHEWVTPHVHRGHRAMICVICGKLDVMPAVWRSIHT